MAGLAGLPSGSNRVDNDLGFLGCDLLVLWFTSLNRQLKNHINFFFGGGWIHMLRKEIKNRKI